MTTEPEVLKVDTRGRVRVPAERREALLAEFERSGLSGVKFAQLAGVKYPTFALWVQKRKKARHLAGPAQEAIANPSQTASTLNSARPLRLFEAFSTVAHGAEERGDGLMVELPGGGVLRVRRPAELSLAVELLRQLAHSGTHPC
jgi:hypothetical protein